MRIFFVTLLFFCFGLTGAQAREATSSQNCTQVQGSIEKRFTRNAIPSKQCSQKKAYKASSRTALMYGNVCRNGAYWCVGVGSGPVGWSCCGCGFCGWWSTW